MVNGSPILQTIWQENVTVLPNTVYYFFRLGNKLKRLWNYAQLQFSVNSTLVGTTQFCNQDLKNNNPPFNWIQFYGKLASGAATAAVIKIVDVVTYAPETILD